MRGLLAFKISTIMMLALVLTACSGASTSLIRLEPEGAALNVQPAEIKNIYPNTPAAGSVTTGEQIIDVNGTPIHSIQDWFDYMINARGQASSMSVPITLLAANGSTRIIPAKDVWDPIEGKSYVEFQDTGVVSVLHLPKQNFSVAAVHDGNLIIVASMGIWKTQPQILACEISIDAKGDAVIPGISLYGSEAERELPIVTSQQVSTLIYPVLNAETNPVAIVPIPPHTLTGYTSNTFVSGNFNQGSFTASGTTTTTPNYNYSATNGAELANAIAHIKNNNAAQQSQYRRDFVVQAGIGSLRTGKVAKGQKEHGVLLFENLGNATGQYALVIQTDSGPVQLTFSTLPQ